MIFSTRRATALLVATVFSAVLPTPIVATELRTVALSGQHPAGTPSGTTYRFFNDPPVINKAGHTAFEAFLNDANQNILGEGLWSEGSGTLELVVLEDSQTPDAPAGATFVSFSTPILNDSGKLAFVAHSSVSNPGPSYSGLFTHESGNTHAVILDDNQAPGMPSGLNFSGLINGIALLNSAGDVASKFFFGPNAAQSTNNFGVWATNSGTLGLVARVGGQVSDGPAGLQYSFLYESPVLNDAGELAFVGSVSGTGVEPANDMAIWSGVPGDPRIVARKGQPAPGTLVDIKFGYLNEPVINSSGQTAFGASVTGNGVNASNERGIWSEGSGSLQLVARSGAAAPGTESGVLFTSFGDPVLNDDGHTAFDGSLTGSGVDVTNSRGVWAGADNELSLVIRSGSQAPGTPAGAAFETFATPALNANGQVAFTAGLFIPRQIVRNGPIVGNPAGGVNSLNNSGLWATDMHGTLHLIAREGDLLEVAPNEFKTINSIFFEGNTGNGDGRPSGFNDLGQIAFAASFREGGSGVFVSSVVAVPEPTSLLAAGMALFVMASCTRRSRTICT